MTVPERLRATYAFQPTDRFIRQEFYIWNEAIARWKGEGLPDDWQEKNLFQFDEPGKSSTGVNLGWCEPPFIPAYEEKLISRDGPYEVYQDYAGRWLKVFEGRRHGFMPQYIRHPVTGWKDWEEEVAPRLDPQTPERHANLAERLSALQKRQQEESWFITQPSIGGYMYLRALLGPEEILFAFHDQPDLVHAMMRQWATLVGSAIQKVQAGVEIDELYLAEDICYKSGPLISPQMMEEFLLPYYSQIITDARARQTRHMYVHIDTDGFAPPVIPLYRKVGMDMMSPFEIAAGNDVLEIAREYPDLIMSGGIDKRVLAERPEAIDAYLTRVIPPMRKRGGFIPTCDHGVPDNVSLANYLYYRQRMCELDSV